MNLVGFSARNHPQQIIRNGADEQVDDRGTAPEWFDDLNRRLGPFTLDVAAAAHNAKCDRYFTIQDDGLTQSWAGERVWCNPPYSNIGAWVTKAWEEYKTTEGIVMLLPANRTEQVWWQDLVERWRDMPHTRLSVTFLRGRMRFILPGHDRIEPNQRPPFGCCLLKWSPPPLKPGMPLWRMDITTSPLNCSMCDTNTRDSDGWHQCPEYPPSRRPLDDRTEGGKQ